MSLRLKLALALALAVTAPASAGSWIPVGPEGGDARGLAVDPRDPRILYLGTADGTLYRSEDAGRRWARLAPGFPLRGMSLDDIVVDPRGRVLVGYWEVGGSGGGVALSLDGGHRFETLSGIAGQAVRSLALAPSDPDVIVAGTMTGVMRSRDGGSSWQRISPEEHPDLKTVGSVAIDPLDPERIYAGTWHLAWRSPDGGRSWHSLRAGMIDDSDVMTLTVDRRSRQTVYATACSGIYRSYDAGGRWQKLRGIPGSSRRTRAFVQDPERPESLYAGTTEGLWTSPDDGASWQRLTESTLVVNAIAVLPGGTLVLATDGVGVLRSEDRGVSWHPSSQGFFERFVSRLVFDGGRGRVIAGLRGDRQHGGGVQVAASLEGPWTRLAGGLPEREILALALAGDDVLAGTDDGVFLSDARAARWRRLPTVLAGRDAHPRVSDLLAVSERVFLAATSGGLLRSTDRGERWQRVVLGASTPVTALAASPQGGNLLASTALGVHESADLGESWSRVTAPLAFPSLQSMAFGPGDGRVVYATTQRGLLRSDDAGRNWARLASLPTIDIAALALHPDGRTLYAAGYGTAELFRSDDGGDSWRAVPTEGLAASRILLLAVDPARPERLLAAGASGGLHLLAPPQPAVPAGSSRP